jgi:hypothetical protein
MREAVDGPGRVMRDNGTVQGANGGTDDQVGRNALLGQCLKHPDLARPEAPAAPEDETDWVS